MRAGTLRVLAARQLDKSPVGQFDVEEEEHADGDDDDRPQKAVDGVGLCVDLMIDGVVERLRVVETAERLTDWIAMDEPVDLGDVQTPCLVTDAQ